MCTFPTSDLSDALAWVNSALENLLENPGLLERDRERFSLSPQPSQSPTPGQTTAFGTPVFLSEEQQHLVERRERLEWERNASIAILQFETQKDEAIAKLWKEDLKVDHTGHMAAAVYHKDAEKLVRDSWIEQGIWDDRWGQRPMGPWKHEKPLQLRSEDETPTEVKEVMSTREREREASRPIYQFLYQISKERERIQVELASRGSLQDANTTAYENVKSIWNQRGIWNRKWGILPGMLWKHEEPLDEEVANVEKPLVYPLLVKGVLVGNPLNPHLPLKPVLRKEYLMDPLLLK